jgi:hypothetical protein
LGRYLDIAKDISRRTSEPASQSASPENLTKPDTENARRLLKAGWKPKVSFGGKVIWERPGNGFYYSEEAAICVLELIQSASQPEVSNEYLENNPMQGATLPNDFDKKGEQ